MMPLVPFSWSQQGRAQTVPYPDSRLLTWRGNFPQNAYRALKLQASKLSCIGSAQRELAALLTYKAADIKDRVVKGFRTLQVTRAVHLVDRFFRLPGIC
jgi:hypothetical protein